MADQVTTPIGTGNRFGGIVVVLAGLAALSASLLTAVYVPIPLPKLV